MKTKTKAWQQQQQQHQLQQVKTMEKLLCSWLSLSAGGDEQQTAKSESTSRFSNNYDTSICRKRRSRSSQEEKEQHIERGEGGGNSCPEATKSKHNHKMHKSVQGTVVP